MKVCILIFSFVLFTSCNNSAENRKNDKDTTTTPGIEKPVNDLGGCYMKITDRDTTILMLTQNGNELTGKMIFDNYQKDGSSGRVKGKIENEIIKLWYEFFAEGMHSMMELYFKEENGKLIRGSGEIGIKGDTAYFITPEEINYPQSGIFEKTNCGSLKEKLDLVK